MIAEVGRDRWVRRECRYSALGLLMRARIPVFVYASFATCEAIGRVPPAEREISSGDLYNCFCHIERFPLASGAFAPLIHSEWLLRSRHPRHPRRLKTAHVAVVKNLETAVSRSLPAVGWLPPRKS